VAWPADRKAEESTMMGFMGGDDNAASAGQDTARTRASLLPVPLHCSLDGMSCL